MGRLNGPIAALVLVLGVGVFQVWQHAAKRGADGVDDGVANANVEQIEAKGVEHMEEKIEEKVDEEIEKKSGEEVGAADAVDSNHEDYGKPPKTGMSPAAIRTQCSMSVAADRTGETLKQCITRRMGGGLEKKSKGSHSVVPRDAVEKPVAVDGTPAAVVCCGSMDRAMSDQKNRKACQKECQNGGRGGQRLSKEDQGTKGDQAVCFSGWKCKQAKKSKTRGAIGKHPVEAAVGGSKYPKGRDFESDFPTTLEAPMGPDAPQEKEKDKPVEMAKSACDGHMADNVKEILDRCNWKKPTGLDYKGENAKQHTCQELKASYCTETTGLKGLRFCMEGTRKKLGGSKNCAVPAEQAAKYCLKKLRAKMYLGSEAAWAWAKGHGIDTIKSSRNCA